jgi:hypothetical protein
MKKFLLICILISINEISGSSRPKTIKPKSLNHTNQIIKKETRKILQIIQNFTSKLDEEILQSESLLTRRINHIESDLLQLKRKSDESKVSAKFKDSKLEYEAEIKQIRKLLKDQQKVNDRNTRILFAVVAVTAMSGVTLAVAMLYVILKKNYSSSVIRVDYLYS